MKYLNQLFAVVVLTGLVAIPPTSAQDEWTQDESARLEKLQQLELQEVQRNAEQLQVELDQMMESFGREMDGKLQEYGKKIERFAEQNRDKLESWGETYGPHWEEWSNDFQKEFERWAQDQDSIWSRWSNEYSKKFEQLSRDMADRPAGELSGDDIKELMEHNLEMIGDIPIGQLVDETIRKTTDQLKDLPWDSIEDAHKLIERAVGESMEEIEYSSEELVEDAEQFVERNQRQLEKLMNDRPRVEETPMKRGQDQRDDVIRRDDPRRKSPRSRRNDGDRAAPAAELIRESGSDVKSEADRIRWELNQGRKDDGANTPPRSRRNDGDRAAPAAELIRESGSDVKSEADRIRWELNQGRKDDGPNTLHKGEDRVTDSNVNLEEQATIKDLKEIVRELQAEKATVIKRNAELQELLQEVARLRIELERIKDRNDR